MNDRSPVGSNPQLVLNDWAGIRLFAVLVDIAAARTQASRAEERYLDSPAGVIRSTGARAYAVAVEPESAVGQGEGV